MSRTIEELPGMIEFAADHKIDAVWINNLWPPTERLSQEVLYDPLSDEILRLGTRVMQQMENLGVKRRTFPEIVRKYILCAYHGDPIEEMLSPQQIDALRLSQEAAVEAHNAGGELSITRRLERDEKNNEHYLEIFDSARTCAHEKGIALFLPEIIPRTRRVCPFVPEGTCFIGWDGSVKPCSQLSHNITCFHYGREKKVDALSFGNITEQDVMSIWQSEPYREFRDIVERFPFSPCGDCHVADTCEMIYPEFSQDCYAHEQPCGDCLWSRGILQCPV